MCLPPSGRLNSAILLTIDLILVSLLIPKWPHSAASLFTSNELTFQNSNFILGFHIEITRSNEFTFQEANVPQHYAPLKG